MPVKNLLVLLVIVQPVITNLWFCYLPTDFILFELNIIVVPFPHAMPSIWCSLLKAVWQL